MLAEKQLFIKPSMEAFMSKARDTQKMVKKKAEKSLKEKRKEKKAKKAPKKIGDSFLTSMD